MLFQFIFLKVNNSGGKLNILFLLTGALFFLSDSFLIKAQSIQNDFDKGPDQWISFGEGESFFSETIGHNSKGSLSLINGHNQETTWNKKFKDLTPGTYELSLWLRGLNLELGQWNYGVWIFYDGGKGTKNLITSGEGTFNWNQLRASIKVSGNSLALWVRLKGPGQLWIDDVSLVKNAKKIKKSKLWFSQSSLPTGGFAKNKNRCLNCMHWWNTKYEHCPRCGSSLFRTMNPVQKVKDQPQKRRLLSFENAYWSEEEDRIDHEQRDQTISSEGKYSLKISKKGYYNLRFKDALMKDWSGYDFVALDVYNENKEIVPFALSLGDGKSKGYWTQINHHTSLGSGWNYLRLSLKEYIGERGSVKVKRYLDLKNLKKGYFDIMADSKRELKSPLYIDNIRLLKLQPPQVPEGIIAIDFVHKKHQVYPGFIPVTSHLKYHPKAGIGFKETQIWKSHDSFYADTLHRDAILINNGKFLVNLKNGSYYVVLVADYLGYWDIPFWQYRKITIQGETVREQRRSGIYDFIESTLRFEKVIPGPKTSPYQTYLKAIFNPILKKVRVKRGILEIGCIGDTSGIGLNSLIIFPAEKKSVGHKFLKKLDQYQQQEYENLVRKVDSPRKQKKSLSAKERKNGFYSAVRWATELIKPGDELPSLSTKINLDGGVKERPAVSILVRNITSKSKKLKIKISQLKSSKGLKISSKSFNVGYGVNHFMSHSANHETYELAPRVLRKMPAKGITLSPQLSQMIWLQLPITKKMKPGLYKGRVKIEVGKNSESIPLTVRVHPYTLPEVDFPVGFFGLNPIYFSYFKHKAIPYREKILRAEALKMIRERGFTTWSGLPVGGVQKKGAKWFLKVNQIDELMKQAKRLGFNQPIFSYGGSFFKDLVRYPKNKAFKELGPTRYHQTMNRLLDYRQRSLKWLPIIYTFSDEATGYSNKWEQDLVFARKLKQYYPSLQRGGFSHMIEPGKKGYELNLAFSNGSYGNMNFDYAAKLKEQNKKWGLYNLAVSPFKAGRFSWGEGLFIARKLGLNHRLEWHFALWQNYPYFDLDGRERDAAMIFPKKDGSFDPALKLEWSALGLADFRLLTLLDNLSKKAKGSLGKDCRDFLASLYDPDRVWSTPSFFRQEKSHQSQADLRKMVVAWILKLKAKGKRH